MEITNFITSEAIMAFMTTLIIVELWVSFTKELRFIKNIPTKFYTFILTVVHLFVINTTAQLFNWNVLGIYTLLCNALIISVMLCGGYDVVTNKITINSNKDK